MDHNLLRLFLCVLLPGVLSAGVSLLNQRSSFGRLPYAVRQITIGVCFGGLAVLFTEFGINIGSATINVRDAAPLCAGLLFGGPAGIIAGVIGAVLVFRPTESARIVTMLLGMSLLAEGILNLCVALCAVKIIRHQQPDVIECEYEVKERKD